MCEKCWQRLGSPRIWNIRTAHALLLTRSLYGIDQAGGPMRRPLSEWLDGCDCPADETPADQRDYPAVLKAVAEDLANTLRTMGDTEKASVLAFHAGYTTTPTEEPAR